MKRGIDVSSYQGDINWALVKADGIDFALIKATQGRSETGNYRNFTDSRFDENIVGAHRWGIRCGVYHYLTAQTVSEAMAEADLFLSAIDPYKSTITLWAAVDVESKYLPTDKTLLTQIVNTFCSKVTSAGYRPMVYTNPDYLKNRLNNITYWDLWLALWRVKTLVPKVEDYPNLKIWQWGKEAVDGITGKTDANYMISDIEVVEPSKPEQEAKPVTVRKDNTASAWAADAVKWCVDNKILLGDEKGDLMLHQPLTREQACLVAKRIYDKIINDTTDRVAKRLIDALGGGA